MRIAALCSPDGFVNFVRPIYQNQACKQSLGAFRCKEDMRAQLDGQSLPEKQNRRELVKQLLAVSTSNQALLSSCL